MLFRRREPQPSRTVPADDSDFETVMSERSGVVLVDFWASWCGPCRMMEPILEEIAVEYAERGVTVVKVNTDESPMTAGDFEIRSIPTLVFFRDGEPQFQMAGLVPKPVLEREIGELLGGEAD